MARLAPDRPGAVVSPEIIAILGVGVALAGFLWRIVTQLGDLRERVARIEGLLEGSLLHTARRNDPTPAG